MSRKRKRSGNRNDAPPPPPWSGDEKTARADRQREGRRVPRFAFGGLAIIAILSLAGFFLIRGRTRPIVFPPPAPDSAISQVAFEDFAGAEACAGCHVVQYEAWRASTHGLAGGTPAERTVGPFNGQPIRFRDATVTPIVRDQTYSFVIHQDGRPERMLTIDGVIGGAHMVGGGTQGFVTRWPDGSLRFLPFEWIRDEAVWFCNTDSRLDRGWLPITPDMALADCGDWTPVRALANLPRFANCQECHGSQFDVPATRGRPNETRYASLSIDCESCHGPAQRHVDAMAGSEAAAGDLDVAAMPRSLATLDKDESIQICFRCHALKDALEPGYLPGKPLEQHYSIGLAFLSDDPVFADGRIRSFAYQQGHLWSDCYLSGSMTCTDCHEPHAQSYRDANGLPLNGRFDDGQCTACHASKAVDVERHTQHAAGSAGSRCVACHMPYLQEPSVGNTIRYARSDHTIPIPRPAFDAALGVEVACALCHQDRSVEALQEQTRSWWGEIAPHHPLVAGLASASTLSNRDSLIALLVRTAPGTSDAPRHIAAEIIALGTLLRDHLLPDGPELPRSLEMRLRSAATDAHPDIAALGLSALHWSRGNDRTTRRFLANRLDSLPALNLAVRRRWAILLGFLGDQARAADDPGRAITAYYKALEILPADAGILTRLGLAQLATADPPSAMLAFQRALDADPSHSLAWINLGIARAATGDASGAARAYTAALQADSTDALAWFNLGNVELRASRFEQAIAYYRNTIRFDPSLAPAHFNLARALILLDRPDEAAIALRDGLGFEPDNEPARAALRDINSRQ